MGQQRRFRLQSLFPYLVLYLVFQAGPCIALRMARRLVDLAAPDTALLMARQLVDLAVPDIALRMARQLVDLVAPDTALRMARRLVVPAVLGTEVVSVAIRRSPPPPLGCLLYGTKA